MKKKDYTYALIILIFLLSCAVSWNLYFKIYSQKDTVDIKHFPQQINSWVAEDMPIAKEDLDVLETQNAFVRRYQNPQKEEVYLFIVYSQYNRKVSHPPEVCYMGSGVSVTNEVSDLIVSMQDGSLLKANRLTVEKGQEKQIVFYWFKVGDTFTSNYWKQQILIALKSFLGQPSSSALIRISAQVKGDNISEATNRIKKFGQLIVPDLHSYLP